MTFHQQGEPTLDLNTPEVLKGLLEAHNLEVETREDWCVPDGVLPAIRTVWVAGETAGTGRLDVEVVLTDERRLTECFAGIGTSPEEQQKDALQNFLMSSFHVLLAAFWGRVDTDQVDVRKWVIDGTPWTAYVGGFSKRLSVGIDVDLPERYFEQITGAIQQAPLDSSAHWCRTFFCNIGSKKRIHEALLDNERWAEGEEMMKAVEWANSDGFYSVRNFLVLSRDSESTG